MQAAEAALITITHVSAIGSMVVRQPLKLPKTVPSQTMSNQNLHRKRCSMTVSSRIDQAQAVSAVQTPADGLAELGGLFACWLPSF